MAAQKNGSIHRAFLPRSGYLVFDPNTGQPVQQGYRSAGTQSTQNNSNRKAGALVPFTSSYGWRNPILLLTAGMEKYASFRVPITEPARKEGPVELATLFTTVSIQRDYGTHLMVFDGRRFEKKLPGQRSCVEPTKEELEQFRLDVANAADNDRKIRDYLNKEGHEKLRLPSSLTKSVMR